MLQNIEIISTLIVFLVLFTTIKISNYFIHRLGRIKQVQQRRIYYVSKFMNLLYMVITTIVLAIIWNVKVGGIMLFASSLFAVIGVALFAQWSILSNLTSSIIIFFTFPARVGDKIKVIDGDNSITGEITEISIFQIQMKDEDNNIILYPNNLFIQKPIMKILQQSMR